MLSQDDKKMIALVALEQLQGNMSAAAEAAGVTRQTLYHWCKDDEEFRKSVKAIQFQVDEAMLDRAEEVIKFWLDRKLDKDVAKWVLAKKGVVRGYGSKVVVEHQGEAFKGNAYPEEPKSVDEWEQGATKDGGGGETPPSG